MEEENGEDSEMIDAMEGWDSDQDDAAARGGTAGTGAGAIEANGSETATGTTAATG